MFYPCGMELFSRLRRTNKWALKSNRNEIVLLCVCCIIFLLGGRHKHNSLPLGSLQPSSPSTKELHDLPR